MRKQKGLFGADGQFLGFGDEEVVELRELFVANRFAEEAIFGRGDIEQWLQSQGTGSCDEGQIPVWKAVLRHIDKYLFLFDSGHADILREMGARFYGIRGGDYELLPAMWKQSGLGNIIAVLAQSSNHEVYLHHEGVIVFEPNTWKVFIIEPGMHVHCGSFRTNLLHIDMVLSVLFAWHHMYAMEVGSRAGDFIRRCARHCIATVREAAEKDFNSAIAVSLDGKVICADTVWEVREAGSKNETLTVRSSEQFQEDKIFLHERYSPISSPSDDPAEVLNLLTDAGFPRHFPQILLRIGRGKVFITQSRYVPSHK